MGTAETFKKFTFSSLLCMLMPNPEESDKFSAFFLLSVLSHHRGQPDSLFT